MHLINTHTHKIINFSTSIGGGLDWSKICQMSSKVCIVLSAQKFSVHKFIKRDDQIHSFLSALHHLAKSLSLLFFLQVITFIDLAGHERYLKTTIFGMTGHVPDFAMLMVCSINALNLAKSTLLEDC